MLVEGQFLIWKMKKARGEEFPSAFLLLNKPGLSG
jgi:hypothetical protein